MNSERWQRLATLYHKAAVLTPPERTTFLEKECEGDADMRQEIEELLACEGNLGNFLDNTAVETLAFMYGADKSDVTTGGPWDADAVETDYFIGTIIDDRYEVKEYLGSGGMGDVYRGVHRWLATPVAIKRLTDKFRGIKEHRRRFIEEARRAVLLDHENVAKIKDVVEYSDEVFVIMEFVDGQTLRASLNHAFDLDEFLPIAIQCAAALEIAHSHRIVHLDIKPENIMLTAAGKVKVCDFGVARQLAAPDESGGTDQPWTFAGTPAYMAPEVIEGNQFDTRADIFSLGVVFYELLAGKHPFRAGDVQSTTKRIVTAHAPPISRTNGRLPRGLRYLLDAMLAKDPDKRLGSASEVLSELQWIRFRKNFLKDAWHSADEAVRSRPYIAATIALAVTLAIIGIAYIKPFSQYRAENPDAYRNYTEGLGLLREYYRPENIEGAIAKFNQALTFDGGYRKALAGLGLAYIYQYQDHKNQELLQKAQDACLRSMISERLAAAHVCWGSVLQEKDKPNDAIDEFRKAIKYDPNADDAFRGLGKALESQNDFVEAERNYKKAIDISPHYWASYTWLGKFYYNRDRYDDAIKQYEMAFAYSHSNGLVLYSLGVPYFRMGQFDKAIEFFIQSLKVQPSLERARNNLGRAYFLSRRYDKAIPLLTEAASKSDGYLSTGNLAMAYWWNGQKENAIPLFNEAIDRAGSDVVADPQDSEAHLAMSLYYAMLSDRNSALVHLGIVLDAHAGKLSAHDLKTAGMVYAQLGDHDMALDFLDQALHHGLTRMEADVDPEFDILRSSNPKEYASIMAQK